MRTLLLPSGETAYCDDQDFDVVANYSWYLNRSGRIKYATTTLYSRERGKKTLSMHRMIMNPPGRSVVDHIDGNGLNNCRSNLRICSQANNIQGQRKTRGTSRYKGVSRCPSLSKPWQAKIGLNYKLIHIGTFSDEAEAARAYDTAARELYGPFARLNFPSPGERGVA